LAKEIDVGATVTAAIPVPLRATLCGLFVALSVIFRLPLRAPSAAGVNTTEIVQLFPAPRVEGLVGQLFVWLKSESEVAMLLMVSATAWPFLSVTFWTLLAVFTTWLEKDKLVGDTETLWPAATAIASDRNSSASTPRPHR
jgi:hypothetical protein